MARTLRLKKSRKLQMPDKETLKMLSEFVDFAAKKIELNGKPVFLTILHAAPDQPITTGAFNTGDQNICCVVQNRNFIDYIRTIAHEMVHLRQHTQGKLVGEIQEIGGDIEDEANYMAGRVVKEYIKKILTAEQKKHLGLGTF